MRQPPHASKLVAEHLIVTKAEDRRLPEGGQNDVAKLIIQQLYATILLQCRPI